MAISEEYAQKNKYFQPFSLVKDGHEVVPAKNCDSFVLHLAKQILGIDLYRTPNLSIVTRKGYMKFIETVSVLKEPDKVNEPYTADIYEHMYLLEPEFQRHARNRVLSTFQLRSFVRFQQGKTWTLPLWYGEDGKEFETSDHPVYYVSVIPDEYVMEQHGKHKKRLVVSRPHLPNMGKFVHDLTHVPPKNVKTAGATATKVLRDAVGGVDELPQGVMKSVINAVGESSTALAALGTSLKHQAKMSKIIVEAGNVLTEDLGNWSKDADKLITENTAAVQKIRDAGTTAATDVLAEVQDKTPNIKKYLPELSPEAMKMLEIGGEVAEKLNEKGAGVSFADGVKLLEKTLGKQEHAKSHKAPQKSTEKSRSIHHP